MSADAAKQRQASAYKEPIYIALDANLGADGAQPSTVGGKMAYRPAHSFARNPGRHAITLERLPGRTGDAQWSAYRTADASSPTPWTSILYCTVQGAGASGKPVLHSQALITPGGHSSRKAAHDAFNAMRVMLDLPRSTYGDRPIVTLWMQCGYRDTAGEMRVKVEKVGDLE